MFITFLCSFFDGDEPEEEKIKSEIKNEEEEEDISVGQKATHKSQR